MQTFVERMSARLKENPVFSGLDPLRAEHLIKHSLIRRLPRGEVLFEAGARCEGLHAVLDGMLKVYARDGQGHEKVIDLIGRGQTLPGTQPTGDTQHTHHARTLATSTVLVVPYTLLRNELCTDVGMAQRLLDDTSRHLRRMMRELEATTLRSARQRALGSGSQRLIDYLLRHGRGRAGSFVVTLPAAKAEIASQLHLTPEHFSRILHELAQAGLIEMNGRSVRIPDLERLRRGALGCRQMRGGQLDHPGDGARFRDRLPVPDRQRGVLVRTARQRLVHEHMARHAADALEHLLVGDALFAQPGHEPVARARRRHADAREPGVRHGARPRSHSSRSASAV